MKLLVSTDKLAGKVIDGVIKPSYSENMAIHFTDGTSVTFSAINEYGNLLLSENALRNDDYELVRLGVMSEKEHEQVIWGKNEMAYLQKEHAERMEYERLKKKFDG